QVWLSFCASWSGELEKDRTLEADLGRYLAPDAMIHKAADEFLRITENTDHWTDVGRFCIEAVRATLYVWRNKPNPRLGEWADLFVEQEVARRVLGEQSPPHLFAMQISADRARETIPYEKLFDACARQFAEHGPKVLEQLQEIGEKVGYQDLATQLFASLRALPKEGQTLSVDQLLDALRGAHKGRSPEALLGAASKFLAVLGKKLSPDVLSQVADGLREILEKDINTQARAESWLCSHLLREGLPTAVLERITDK